MHVDWRLPHPNDTQERRYILISRGPRFDRYDRTLSQDLFVSPFFDEDVEYQARTLLKKAFKSVKNPKNFKKRKVYRDTRLRTLFESSFGLTHFGLFFLNRKGRAVRKVFSNQLAKAEIDLPRLARDDIGAATKILNQLGSNVLLLNCFNDELIELLKPILSKASEKFQDDQTEREFMEDEMFEYMLYDFMDSLSHFDSSFSSFDSAFDFVNTPGAGIDVAIDVVVGDV